MELAITVSGLQKQSYSSNTTENCVMKHSILALLYNLVLQHRFDTSQPVLTVFR